MKRASIMVLERPPYHGAEVAEALKGLGYAPTFSQISDPRPGDLLVLWNRYARYEANAADFERNGGTVVIMENGYFGRNYRGGPWYALSIGQHNGGGLLPPANLRMWDRIDYPEQDWRYNPDGDIVVLATRHMGSEKQREPQGWAERIAAEIGARIRAHPGAQKDDPVERDRLLWEDIKDAAYCITWGSSAGLKAIMMGIPVSYGLRNWIGSSAAQRIEAGHKAFCGDRSLLKARLATAMWNLDEIRSGEAFRWLLRL